MLLCAGEYQRPSEQQSRRRPRQKTGALLDKASVSLAVETWAHGLLRGALALGDAVQAPPQIPAGSMPNRV